MRLLLVMAAGVAGLMAQSPPTGEIRLQVTDPSGAGMLAAVKVDAAAGAVHRTARTSARGAAAIGALPFGAYHVEVSAKGFATQTLSIDVLSAQPVERTVAMSISSEATRVDVVAATPLSGFDVPLKDVPAPVQVATSRDLEESQSLDLANLLNRRLNGVTINENQSNPFQPDVNYRGYTASPLLGTPEGLSVYMDGVRQNQPFGDIVAWDLIPKIAIQETTLMPGSNPLFGLNTQGGAISIQTKDGYSQPGGSIRVSGGMPGRRSAEAEYGGSAANGFNWYAAGNLYREDGWRRASPSEVRQAFGKVGWLRGNTSLHLSGAYADNWLTGNGLQDGRRLAVDYSSVYNIPDFNWNRSPSLNLELEHSFTPNLTFTGNAHFRYIRADTINANTNPNSYDQSLYNLSSADVAALTAAGYSGFPSTGSYITEPYPYWRCLAQALEKADPSDRCDGVIFHSFSKQNNYGTSGQMTWAHAHNHLSIGGVWDRSSLIFQQTSQFAFVDADGLTFTPVPAYADGSTSSGGVPVDNRVDLHGAIQTLSVFGADTLSWGKWSFNLSGRYNHTTIDNVDRLPPAPSGVRGSLNGNYVYQRFNPAAGVTYKATSFAAAYFSYSESSRAPTAIELGCADPNNPCNLPNALVSDPPLQQVVTRTFEAGVRGTHETGLQWSAGWFRGENHNDLLFVASQQSGFGYFANFGQTRRTGVEANLSGRWKTFTLGGGYTFLNATYQSTETIDGSSNSSNDGAPGLGGNVTIQPGDRIPLIPQHLLKAYADYQPLKRLSIDLDFNAVSRSYARGNENNQDQLDGVYYLGPGTSPGYGVVNLGAKYEVQKHVELFVQINNLLNHHYYTAAQLAPTPYNNAGQFIARPFPAVDGNYPIRSATFYAPGAPILVFGGLKFRF